jgi:beta-glucanase (GH16 family)
MEKNIMSDKFKLYKKFTFKDGNDVDRTEWESPHWISANNNPSFLGRTSLRNPKDYSGEIGKVPVKNSIAQLRLSTYNHLDHSHQSFLGAQIGTIEKWGLTTYDAVRFEAKVKCPNINSGAVASMFAYHLLSVHPDNRDEIDFEFASKHWSSPNEAVNTNVYRDSSGGGVSDEVVSTTADFSSWLIFRIDWSKDVINWYINPDENPTPLRTMSNKSNVPPTDMHLVFNFWVPNSAWGWAYSSDLEPTGSNGQQEWVYQVEWAKVSTVSKS